MLPEQKPRRQTIMVMRARQMSPALYWAAMAGLAVATAAVMINLARVPADFVQAGQTGAEAPLETSGLPARTAQAPRPQTGWIGFIRQFASNISEHRILSLAAGMTFYSLLAIFPAFAALVAIYGLFSDPSSITTHLSSLSGFLPGGAIDVIREQLTRVAAKGRQSLGWTFLIGLSISLWSANGAMKSMFDTLNVIYDVPETRGIVRLNSTSLAFTLGAIVFALLAIAGVIVLPVVLNYLGLPDRADLLLRIGRWPTLFIILAFALILICQYGPNREIRQWSIVSWGSAFAAFLWIAVSVGFSWYAAHFGSYNETYGSLGAVVGFMTWLWISAIAVLTGAELDAELERRKAHMAASN